MANNAKRKNHNRGGSKKFNDRRSNNGQRVVKEQDVAEKPAKEYSGPVNNPAIYKPDDMLMDQVCEISFRQFLGMRNVLADKDLGVPTTMVIYLNPSLTYTSEDENNAASDGVNMAAYRLWLAMTYKNKRPVDYGPQDITTLLCGIGSIYALASDITRTFGLLRVFNYRNKIYPASLIKYANTDLTDAQIADLRADFNYAVMQFNNFPVPANLEYLNKCSKIFSGVYLDESGSNMAQSYLFTPASLWKFDDAYNEQGSGLRTVPITAGMTLKQKIDLFKELATAITGSTSLGVIQGDLLRAAEDQGWGVMALGQVPTDYVVLPNTDDELALWLDNATIAGFMNVTGELAEATGHTPSNDVVPSVNKNCVIYRPSRIVTARVTEGTTPKTESTSMLNFWHENPSTDEKIIATRLHNPYTTKFVANGQSTSEIIDKCAMCDWYISKVVIPFPYPTWGVDAQVVDSESTIDAITITTSEYSVDEIVSTSTQAAHFNNARRYLAALLMLTQFNHHPMIYVNAPKFAANGWQAGHTMFGVNADLQFFTEMGVEDIKAIQDVAICGLLKSR